MRKAQAENVYLPKAAVLDRVVDEIQDVKTFFFHFQDPAEQRAFKAFMPGQFAQVSICGAGEIPISLPPSPTEDELFAMLDTVDHAVDLVGGLVDELRR